MRDARSVAVVIASRRRSNPFGRTPTGWIFVAALLAMTSSAIFLDGDLRDLDSVAIEMRGDQMAHGNGTDAQNNRRDYVDRSA